MINTNWIVPVNFKDTLETDLDKSWLSIIKLELSKSYFIELQDKLNEQIERFGGESIFPPRDLVFNAFRQCPYDKVKVVIIGQDPYHNTGGKDNDIPQAMGLSFSVNKEVKIPPS